MQSRAFGRHSLTGFQAAADAKSAWHRAKFDLPVLSEPIDDPI